MGRDIQKRIKPICCLSSNRGAIPRGFGSAVRVSLDEEAGIFPLSLICDQLGALPVRHRGTEAAGKQC